MAASTVAYPTTSPGPTWTYTTKRIGEIDGTVNGASNNVDLNVRAIQHSLGGYSRATFGALGENPYASYVEHVSDPAGTEFVRWWLVKPGTTKNMLFDYNGLSFPGLGTTINEFSTDTSLGGNSDSAVPTEKAVKTFVDAHKNSSSNVHGLGLAVHTLGHRAGAGRFVQHATGATVATSSFTISVYYTTTVSTPSYPVAFSATPTVLASSNSNTWAGINVFSVSTTGFSWQGWSYGASISTTLAYLAIGT